MEYVDIKEPWLKRVLPEGWPIHTSTLIGGPGGSGKPLIGNVVVASWLQAGGSVVFMSLQYPDHEFIASAMRRLTGLELADYYNRIEFIELDTTVDGIEPRLGRRFGANLVKPDIWDAAIERACSLVPDEGPGILVYGSALNLLLFSPTYGGEMLERMKRTVRDDKRRTYLFTASSTAKKEEIEQVEAAADNLLVSQATRRPFRLRMRVERMPGVPFISDEVEVPIPPEELTELKKIADHNRKRVIPLVSAI